MKKYYVTALVGSLRKDSHNLKLAKAIKKLSDDKIDLHIAMRLL